MITKNATSSRALIALRRQQQAVELRRAGRSYREIAHQVGIGVASAHRLVAAAISKARVTVQDEVIEMRALELSRLDGLLSSVWPAARQGNLGAIDRVLKIMERRAKLLGLDAPVKMSRGNPVAEEDVRDAVRYIVPVPTTMSFEEWLCRLGPANGRPST